MLLLKCLQTLTLRLELGRQLDLLARGGLQRVAGLGLCCAGLLLCLFEVLLPGLGAAVFAQQRLQGLAARMVLRAQFVQRLLQRIAL